jgi:hypothetical protein
MSRQDDQDLLVRPAHLLELRGDADVVDIEMELRDQPDILVGGVGENLTEGDLGVLAGGIGAGGERDARPALPAEESDQRIRGIEGRNAALQT